MNTAVVVTHPYPRYDDGVTEQAVEAVLEEAADTYLIASSEESVGTPHGGKESYDHQIPDTYNEESDDGRGGRLFTQDAHDLVANYDDILLGGGWVRSCLHETYTSLVKAAEEDEASLDLSIVPELSFGKFHIYGNAFTTAFTLEQLANKDIEGSKKAINTFYSLSSCYDWETVSLDPVLSPHVHEIKELESDLRELVDT